MRVLQINTTVNSGSTGRIAEDLGNLLISEGYSSYIAYGRGKRPSNSQLIKIGFFGDIYFHGIISLFFDRHGFASAEATKKLIKKIKSINPDIIHIHNLHGYYLHIGILLKYLAEANFPVVLTMHDCWSFTGHCTYFELEGCFKWKSHCNNCPKISSYPKSILFDNSYNNYELKKRLFTSIKNLVIVTPSEWLRKYVKESFLGNRKIFTIYNGVDLNTFKPIKCNLVGNYEINKPYILGVANVWTKRKGLKDFLALRNLVPLDIDIILIGLDDNMIKKMPNGIIGIRKTESIEKLALFYSNSLCYVNPTYQDNFPTTNIEALACGTPVITYDTGGSPESIDNSTGIVVSKGDVKGLANAINKVLSIDRDLWRDNCRKRAVKFFNKEKQYYQYLEIYNSLLNRNI